ncbi:alpha/beta fold hydrolase [Rhodoferax sp.]|uniref:alpha/beta fold hydrolase n=1 Tax=Rhodoferax sp. TaxID=50421 RepID=UPI00263793B9|nr:alpha/beta fold hydrolase [Rhodoferax sp.]MDD2808645.1 alpha/beta fold hydrolase [Rhodoferax sp.]
MSHRHAQRTPVVFSHANSFGAGTYQLLFDTLRTRGVAVEAIDKFGHDPHYPVSNNWPHLVQQLVDFTVERVNRLGQPVFLVGHSLGGFLSLMAASQAPQAVRGALLLDSPVVGGWRATALGLAKSTRLVGSVSPGKVSRKRRQHWPDEATALSHFAAKRTFAKWHPQVLKDYIHSGTHDELVQGQPQRVLSFTREVETAIYNTLPSNLEAQFKHQPIQCPVAFIGGTHSAEIRQVGMALTQRITQGRIMMVDGSHLFPMEKPLVTAAAIEAALLNLQALS